MEEVSRPVNPPPSDSTETTPDVGWTPIAEEAARAARLLHPKEGELPRPGRRRVLSLRYLSDHVRHAPRRWRTSPPFEGLDEELAAGAPMEHPLFPVVWPPA